MLNIHFLIESELMYFKFFITTLTYFLYRLLKVNVHSNIQNILSLHNTAFLRNSYHCLKMKQAGSMNYSICNMYDYFCMICVHAKIRLVAFDQIICRKSALNLFYSLSHSYKYWRGTDYSFT